jgi:hypothetical protein
VLVPKGDVSSRGCFIAPRDVSGHAQKMFFHCAITRCFCACAKRGYFIAPRGDVSAHAQREDISLRQEKILQLKHKL